MCEHVWDLNKKFPTEISKPSRGLFIPATVSQAVVAKHAEQVTSTGIKESDFYEPFAEWLKKRISSNVTVRTWHIPTANSDALTH
jgi:hypothetical protein